MDLAGIGRRIRQARERCLQQFPTQKALAEALFKHYKDPGKAPKLGYTKESVRTWENGTQAPPLEVIEQIATLTGDSEEHLLFGIRRDKQMRDEVVSLEWLKPLEKELLTIFREADPKIHKAILKSVKAYQEASPAPTAGIIRITRRKP